MAILGKNRRASRDYSVQESFTAGISLLGGEVKSAKQGSASLDGSFVRIRNKEAWLVNAYIARYQANSDYDERRPRKLLLQARELNKLLAGTEQGLHIVPVRLETVRSFVKLRVGLAKIRRKVDKRNVIKARDDARRVERVTKLTV